MATSIHQKDPTYCLKHSSQRIPFIFSHGFILIKCLFPKTLGPPQIWDTQWQPHVQQPEFSSHHPSTCFQQPTWGSQPQLCESRARDLTMVQESIQWNGDRPNPYSLPNPSVISFYCSEVYKREGWGDGEGSFRKRDDGEMVWHMKCLGGLRACLRIKNRRVTFGHSENMRARLDL